MNTVSDIYCINHIRIHTGRDLKQCVMLRARQIGISPIHPRIVTITIHVSVCVLYVVDVTCVMQDSRVAATLKFTRKYTQVCLPGSTGISNLKGALFIELQFIFSRRYFLVKVKVRTC